MRIRNALPVALLAAALLPHAALAQSVNAGRVPQGSPIPRILPPTPPPIGPGAPNFQPGPASETPLPNATITVKSVSVIGVTAFSQMQTSPLTGGLAGQTVPLAKIEAARLGLLNLYRGHGYVLSTVSLDIDADGNVRFVVIEGRIVDVKLSQDIGPAGTMVLQFLSHLTEERPVKEASLERWLLLAQEVPGVSVHAILQSESDDPGALTLVAEVSMQKVSALVTADKRGFDETGPAEGLAVIDVNSLTSFGDQTEVSLYHTSGNTDNFGQAAESFFIGNDGLRLKLYGGSGRAQPSGELHEVGYQSSTTVFGGALSYPLLLRRNQALSTYFKFDALQSEINTAGALTSSDSLRTVRAAGQYAWDDLWLGDSRDALNISNFQLSKGLTILGASADGRSAPPAGRANQRVDFWKLNASIERTQTLFSPLPNATVALRLAAGGQYTTDILPTEEEFNLGGPQFTRGYYSGQVIGDKAAYATAELQYNTGTNFHIFSRDIDLGAQFYTFYDWGETWSNSPFDLDHKIESEGVGVRIGVTRNLEVDGEFVRRLTTRLDPAATGIKPLTEGIAYWGLTARY